MQNCNEKHTAFDMTTMTRFLVCSALVFVLCNTIATDAHAVGAALCTMINTVMSGGLARAIATIGVLMVGVGATLGKVSWTLAITVAVGIAAMFATASLVQSISGQMGCFGS